MQDFLDIDSPGRAPVKEEVYAYVTVGLLLAGYLGCVIYDVEFFYFLVVLCLVVLFTAIIRFEAAFLFVPLVLTNPYTFEETGSSLQVSEIVLLIIFFVWFVNQIVERPSNVVNKRFILLGSIIVIAAILSISVARYLVPAIEQIVRFVEMFLVLFLIVTNTCVTEKQIRRVFLFLIVGGLGASLLGIFQFITGERTVAATRRVFGLHGGGYGALISSVLFYCLAVITHERDRFFRLVAFVTIPFASLALVLSQTRTWIGTSFLVILLVLFKVRRKIFLRALVVMGVAVLVVFVALETDGFGLVSPKLLEGAIHSAFRFEKVAGTGSSLDPSLLLRFSVWAHSAAYFMGSPLLGIGAGNLRISNYVTGSLTDPSRYSGYVDNQFIQFFTEIGVFGGIAWLLYVFFAWRQATRAHSLARGSHLESVALGFYASILVFIIGSFFWVFTPNHELFAIFVLQVALLVNIERLMQ